MVKNDVHEAKSALLPTLIGHISHADIRGMKGAGDNETQIIDRFDQLAGIFEVTTLPKTFIKSLSLLSMAHELYAALPGATIDTNIMKTALHDSKWLNHSWRRRDERSTRKVVRAGSISETDGGGMVFPRRPLERAERFACIALFESGSHNVASSDCEQVIALASANSIFVAEELLADPSAPKSGGVSRVVGNFGRAGISMLVLPSSPPQIRPLCNEWRAVPHEPYDYRREDNLSGATLVLSFTDWKRPLSVSERGTIDEDLNYVEGVVSVHDRGTWVADLDLTDATDCMPPSECCDNCDLDPSDGEISSIDSWEDLLDAPDNVAVFRAHGNWVARLAAVAIRRQQGHWNLTCVVSQDQKLCVKCVSKAFKDWRFRLADDPVGVVTRLENQAVPVGVIID